MLEKKNCTKNAPKLEPQVVKAMLGQLSGWALAEKEKAIFRKWVLPDFDSAFALAGKIADIAKEQNHHPDISFGWGFVKIRLTTHVVDGLSENDFIVAAKINLL